jgi:hypothetical protein
MFIALEVMAAIRAALETAHDDSALGQIDIVTTKIAGFRDPQTRGDRSRGRSASGCI